MNGSRLLLLAAVLLSACPPVPPDTRPTLAPPNPEIRIGVAVDVQTLQVGGTLGVRIIDPEEGMITALVDSAGFDLAVAGGDVVLRHPRIPDIRRAALIIEPLDSTGRVVVDGRVYRGSLELRTVQQALVVVNRISLEEYLVGVVSAEMGTRQPDEINALKAQAVAARTYALRNRGRWSDRGFDLIADVTDQVYTGVNAENALAAQAVADTRGEVVTYDGELIDAFFFSTCAGHTEDGQAAFAGAERPYLRSVADLDSTGTAWCVISPRFTWSEAWTASELSAILKHTLPANDLPVARGGDLTDLRIVDRTASRRVALLELVGRNGRTSVTGQTIRRVLAPATGGILRSNDFTITLTRQGGRLVRIQANGRGNGHGVGMCQWGAIGRARAGQDYRTILTSYFPGTTLTRMYQ